MARQALLDIAERLDKQTMEEVTTSVGGSQALRSFLTAGMLALFSLAMALLAAPAASAGLQEAPPVSSGAPAPAPMMLASTGLDITVPVVIGLGVLVLGTMMVGWAFLATGRRSQHH